MNTLSTRDYQRTVRDYRAVGRALSVFLVTGVLMGAPLMAQTKEQYSTNPWSGFDYRKPINGAYYVPLQRKFPPAAQKATLNAIHFPLYGAIQNRAVVLDNKTRPVSANFRLYDDKGGLLLPKDYPSNVTVAYLATNGAVSKVWVLSNDESKNFTQLLK